MWEESQELVKNPRGRAGDLKPFHVRPGPESNPDPISEGQVHYPFRHPTTCLILLSNLPWSPQVCNYCHNCHVVMTNCLGEQLCIAIVKPALETTCLLLLSNLPWRAPVSYCCQTSLGKHLSIAIVKHALETTYLLLLSNLPLSPLVYSYCQTCLGVNLWKLLPINFF